MDELDLSGVDALRRSEVIRRIGVVKDFLADPNPTDASRKSHADLLGLGVSQFLALVRAWRTHKSAAMMAGSGAHRGGSRRPSRISVPKAAKEEAARIIAEMGPDAPVVRITEAVFARCEQLNVTAPSRSTLWNMVMASRKRPHGEDDGIVLGICAVRLPMASDDGVTLPFLTLAVHTGDGAILAAALEDANWIRFVTGVSSGEREVRVDQSLLPANGVAGVSAIKATAARSAISRILGRGIVDVGLIYQPSRAIAPERLLRTKEDRPLVPCEIREVVSAAIARHNEERNANGPIWVDAPDSGCPSTSRRPDILY
ncbi:MAG: hypothetical protein ABIV36_19310 [Sphingobium limneticum]